MMAGTPQWAPWRPCPSAPLWCPGKRAATRSAGPARTGRLRLSWCVVERPWSGDGQLTQADLHAAQREAEVDRAVPVDDQVNHPAALVPEVRLLALVANDPAPGLIRPG